jgi:hypothetical protein
MEGIHYIDEIVFGAARCKKCRFVTNTIFVSITDDADRTLIVVMNSQFGAKVKNRLKARVQGSVATLAMYMSLLCEDSVYASIFDASFTTTVVALESNMSVIFYL